MTTGRTIVVAVGALVAFAAGVYAGLSLIVAVVDLGRPFEVRFVVATVGIGTALAILAAGAVAPGGKAWGRIAVAGATTGVLAIALLAAVGSDAAALIPVGLVVATAVTWGARSGRT